MRRSIAVLLSLALLGCASAATAPPETSLNRSIDASPEDVVEAAETVFAGHNIPVSRVSAENGLVQSEEFTVEGQWEGVEVEERFDCGEEAGVPKAMGARIEVRLTATAEATGQGTDLRLQYDARGVDPQGEAMAEGDPILSAMAGGFTCHLNEPFIDQLMGEIRDRV